MTDMTERVQQLLDGTLPLTSLNLTDAGDLKDFDAAVSASKGKVLLTLVPGDPATMQLLYDWVDHDPVNVLKISPEYYFPEILEPYFVSQMALTKPKDDKDGSVLLQKSLDGYYSFLVDYTTHAGEEFRYIDADLHKPTVMTTSLEVHVKIADMYLFLSGLDIELSALSYRKVERYLNSLVIEAFRPVMMVALDKKKIGYFSLRRYYRAICDAAGNRFNAETEFTGLMMSDIRILDTKIPESDVIHMEKSFAAYTKQQQKLEFDLRAADMALANYERKAAIHAKYPNFPVAATEAEKDLALDRMLKKMGVYEEPTITEYVAPDAIELPTRGITKEQLFVPQEARPEKPIPPVAPQMPVKPKKPANYVAKNMPMKLVLIVLASVVLIGLSLIPALLPMISPELALSENISFLTLFLPIAVAIVCDVAIALYVIHMILSLKKAPRYKDENDAYDAACIEYKKQVVEYKRRMQNVAAEDAEYQQKLLAYEEEMKKFDEPEAVAEEEAVAVVEA